MRGRSLYTANHAEEKIFLTDDTKNHYVSCAMPIFAEGDVIGCVASVGSTDGKSEMLGTDTEVKLIQTAAPASSDASWNRKKIPAAGIQQGPESILLSGPCLVSKRKFFLC